MRHLEEVHGGQSASQEDRVDALLDVAGQQEAPLANLAQQHDRHVVDARARVGWLGWDRAGVRPQHLEPDIVEGEVVSGREQRRADASRGESRRPSRVARARSAHPRLEHAPHLVPLQQGRQAGDMVLVRMGQHQCIDAPIPRRQSLVERD
jgi:hypothetical protein